MADRERRDDDTPSEPSDILDIDLDDLDDEGGGAPDSGLPPAPAGDAIVIELEDLDDIPDAPAYAPPAGAYPPVADAYPPVGGPGAYPPVDMKAGYDLYAKAKKGPVAAIFGNMMLQMLIAGLIGGLIAWIINEPWTHDLDPDALRRAGESIYATSALFFAVLGAMVGMALGAVEGLLTGAYGKMARDAALGLAIGAVGGACAGFVGQLVYALILGTSSAFTVHMFGRTVGWALVGIFVGLAQGARYLNTRRLVNGLVGGLLGGAVGGLLFDPIGAIVGGGEVSRLIALGVLGAATGAAIGLLEEVRKEAWVTIVEGPLTGKEFILYRQVTTIGSGAHCDIPLLKDRSVAPEHARVQQSGGGFLLVSLVGADGVLVNDHPSGSHPLSSGDVIRIGMTTLFYQDRAVQ